MHVMFLQCKIISLKVLLAFPLKNNITLKHSCFIFYECVKILYFDNSCYNLNKYTNIKSDYMFLKIELKTI